MITEAQMQLANGLVARFYSTKPQRPFEERWAIQLQLLKMGVELDRPLQTPDPRAPQGGSPIAMRVAA